MGVAWKYRPAKISAGLVVHAALPLAERRLAEAILADSQKVVPVEEGVLLASGRVVQNEHGTYVTYGRNDDGDVQPTGADPRDQAPSSAVRHAPSNDYAVVQHEDMQIHHPNGGHAKFLEEPFHSDQGERLATATEVLRKALSR